jgi:hypothetical protein
MSYTRKHRIRKKRRNDSACVVGRVSRRLRIELMERRMMLSANAPTVEVSLPSVGLEAGEVRYLFNFGATHVSLVSPMGEGGYVLNAALDLDGAATMTRSYYGEPPTIDSLTNEDSSLGTFGEIGGVESNELFGASGPVPQALDVFTPSGPSPVVQPDEAAPIADVEEGGWISIKSILDPHGPGVAAKRDGSFTIMGPVKALPLAKADAEESSVDESLAQVSGEWARAAVFEIAGGEPAAATLTMKETHFEFDPISTESSEAGKAESAAFTDADVERSQANVGDAAADAQERERSAEAASQTSSLDAEQDMAARSTLEYGDELAQAPLGIPLFDRASRATSVANAASLSADDVLAAAFNEFGDAELALAAPSSDNLRLSNWLSSTPLLLIFAVERVTARRSRARQASYKMEIRRPPRR